MVKTVSNTVTYRDASSFGTKYVKYEGNREDGITVSYGSFADHPVETAEEAEKEEGSFKIGSYELSNLAIFWLDHWHREEINWRMRSVPDELRHLGSIVWSGEIGVSFSYNNMPIEQAKEEFEKWYFSKDRNSW